MTRYYLAKKYLFTYLCPLERIIGTCDIWDIDYNTDNWEPGFMQGWAWVNFHLYNICHLGVVRLLMSYKGIRGILRKVYLYDVDMLPDMPLYRLPWDYESQTLFEFHLIACWNKYILFFRLEYIDVWPCYVPVFTFEIWPSWVWSALPSACSEGSWFSPWWYRGSLLLESFQQKAACFRRDFEELAFGELSESLSDQQITLDPTGSKH